MAFQYLVFQAMKDKDPELWDRISWMPRTEAVLAWRDVYPEDFEGVTRISPVSVLDDLTMVKPREPK